MPSTKINVSIVIPVYRGAASIGRLVDELIATLKPLYTFEIVLVNDDSPDNSEEVCIALHQRYPSEVRFFSLAKNVGEHNAVMAGLNYAGGETIVIMDDDFQNPCSEVVKLLKYAQNNAYDVVYTYYAQKKHSLFRNLGSRFNDFVANFMLRKPRDLYLSSFKSINYFLAKEIIKYDLPYPYIDGLILRATSKIGKIAVEHRERREGKSGYTLAKLVRLWLNMFTNFSIMPLRISFFMGLLFSLLGLVFGAIVLIEKLTNPNVPMGYTTIIVVLLIFAGVQFFSLGMIGEYIGRIFLSQNKKPQFTVRRRFDAHSQE